MSIFKSVQRDPRYFIGWLEGLLFRRPCQSYLAEYKGKRRACRLRRGHAKQHTDGDITWGYGDNWLESFTR